MANMNDLAKEFGKRLSTLRVSRNLTQMEVAIKAGVSDSYIGMMERGDRLPHVPALIAVAKALDVPVTYFFEEEIAASTVADLRLMAPLLTVVKRLKMSPDDVTKAARVVWATFFPFGKMEKPPV